MSNDDLLNHSVFNYFRKSAWDRLDNEERRSVLQQVCDLFSQVWHVEEPRVRVNLEQLPSDEYGRTAMGRCG